MALIVGEYMIDILISNFFTISIIIGLAIQLRTGELFDKKIEVIFSIGLSFIFVLTFADMIDYYLAGQDTLNNFRYVTSILGYIIRPLTLVIFISILLRNKSYNSRLILWLPLIIEAVIVITSPYTHLMFYFDQNNGFHRGPLGYIAHILSAGYDIAFIVVAIQLRRSSEFNEIMTAFYIVIVTSTATLLESGLGLKFLLPGAMAISCTIYYTYLYVQIYKFDGLTELLNRRSFYTSSEKMKNSNFAIISIDLNDLKKVNDTNGHQAGDIFICTVANTLKIASHKKYRLYRTGGDEFMALGLNQDEDSACSFINEVKELLNDTQYTASYGYAMYEAGMDFEGVCASADMNMYEDKKNKKVLNVFG